MMYEGLTPKTTIYCDPMKELMTIAEMAKRMSATSLHGYTPLPEGITGSKLTCFALLHQARLFSTGRQTQRAAPN